MMFNFFKKSVSTQKSHEEILEGFVKTRKRMKTQTLRLNEK